MQNNTAIKSRMPDIPKNISNLLKKARAVTEENFGRAISFFLPGFFIMDGQKGKHPAVSITGSRCALQCEHCKGKILESMMSVPTPDSLLETCLDLYRQGNTGVLISGGCDEKGCLPWDAFIPVIREIKERTGLFVSIHSGIVDEATAFRLKAAGVDQALIDIIGDDRTIREVYHADFGTDGIRGSLAALQKAGLPIVPHIVCGLYFGAMRGEKDAVAMLSEFEVEQVVILSVMPLSGTGFEQKELPEPFEVAQIIAEARLAFPNTPISLGCARPRGGRVLEVLAIDAGINRMALPSDEAMAHARHLGLDIKFLPTCCSVQ